MLHHGAETIRAAGTFANLISLLKFHILATSPGQRAGGAQELHRDAQERTRVAVSGRNAEGGVRLAHGEDL